MILFMILDLVKWMGAAIIAVLLIIAIATGLDYVVTNSCIQETAQIIVDKFGYHGYYWKGQ